MICFECRDVVRCKLHKLDFCDKNYQDRIKMVLKVMKSFLRAVSYGYTDNGTCPKTPHCIYTMALKVCSKGYECSDYSLA